MHRARLQAQRRGTSALGLGVKFFGRYEHSLDEKGRVVLPAKLRAHFVHPEFLSPHLFLTPHLEGCLALWTVEEFDKEVEQRLAQAGGEPASRNAVRDWASAVFEAEIDRQGRIAIPGHLRSYAALEQDVLVIGMINRVELWSPTAWASKDTAS